ncbi:hypothetical protein RHMOL_Rhmol08G0166700 [Rhododendron molle]|uniref:Uncharacterized protein n=1 Tax=Rhododendron molle TaxID=49168 RepID=A0ACC0MP39_RHOML|nr:hypothetical protein RHMOL_Rhmol08G0166700 [Rhododendron molle]
MADHGGNGGGGDVIDCPEDAGGPMEIETETQQPAGAVVGTGGLFASSGDGDGDHQQEVGGGMVQRTPEGVPRVTEEPRALGPSVEPVGSSTVVGGSPMVGGSSGGASGSGAEDGDIGLNGSPSRDSARGKGAVVEEEETTEAPFVYREEDVLFRPAATSSSHRPITKDDVAEYLSNEALAKLLKESPAIGIAVLDAKEERARAIAVSEASERAEGERKER